jgi:restriction endonuclease S subunit
MAVKTGYKLTEVGVIPEDWEVPNLDAIANIVDPQPDHRTPPEMSGGEPYIGISDFQDHGLIDWNGCRRVISKAVDKQQARFQICPGDIIFGKIGTIGSPKFLPLTSFRYALSANIILVQPEIEPYYVMAWLTSSIVQQNINQELHSTSQAAFGINKMRCLPIALPPSSERRAIAAALGDVDALLGALDRLIAKKRDLKQAAMQQLLTGKTRLPGFSGKWELKTFDEVCEKIQDGTHFSPKPGGNDYLYVTSKNIRFGTLDISTAERISAAEHAKIYGRCDVRRGDLLLTKDGANTGNAALNTLNEPFSLLSSVALLRFDDRRYSTAFFLYQLLSNHGQTQIDEMMSGNAITRLTLAKIRALGFAVASFEEQVAIATVLKAMDAELAALEQRLAKTRDIKQAMMQELLTGKTRLPQEAHA